jgi:predicted permease
MLFVNVILPVFVIVLAGYLLQRRAQFDLRPLSDSSLFLFTPALVFASLLRHELVVEQLGKFTIFMLLYTAVMTVIAVAVSRWCRIEGKAGRAMILSAAMMNVGNFGLPLVMFAYGPDALSLSVLAFVLFNFSLSSYAIVVSQGETGLMEATRNMLRIPLVHATLLAFLCKAVDWTPPEFIMRPVELLGQAAVPVMLSLLGMQLAQVKTVSAWGFCALATGLRLLVAPLVGVCLVVLLDIGGLARKVLILQTSTPSAVLTLLYAVRYNTRPDLVSGAILLSTLLSAISLTVILYLLGT